LRLSFFISSALAAFITGDFFSRCPSAPRPAPILIYPFADNKRRIPFFISLLIAVKLGGVYDV